MVFPRIFHRHIYNTVIPNRIKPFENAGDKRLLLKKIENFFGMSNTRNAVYEAEGKTVGYIINKKGAQSLLIDGYMVEGFSLPNGSQVIGSCIIFPHAILSWHVRCASEITKESLVLFKMIEPKIDILVLGYGCPSAYTTEVRLNFTKWCKELGLRFEALPTDKAVGTYNFLAEEQRLVAGALIPPAEVDLLKFDRSKGLLLDSGSYYEEEEEEEELEAIEGRTPIKKLLK